MSETTPMGDDEVSSSYKDFLAYVGEREVRAAAGEPVVNPEEEHACLEWSMLLNDLLGDIPPLIIDNMSDEGLIELLEARGLQPYPEAPPEPWSDF